MNELQNKIAFAAALLKWPTDPFKAAFSVFSDTGTAMQVAVQWRNDPVVLAEQSKLLEVEGPKPFLPTKEDQARDIYDIATASIYDSEVRLKAHRLYAEVMGFIEKPAAPMVNTGTITQCVMIVPDKGTDKEWEKKTIEQQRKLIEHASN